MSKQSDIIKCGQYYKCRKCKLHFTTMMRGFKHISREHDGE